MGRRFVSTGSPILSASSAVVSAAPLTLSAWINGATYANNRTVFGVDDGSSSNRFSIGFSSAGKARFVCTAAGSASNLDTTESIPASTWSHLCGVSESSVARRIYLNSAFTASTTASRTPTGINATKVGRTGGDATAVCLLAFPAAWNTSLTDAEIMQLAQGADPRTIRPQNLVAFWPLNTPGSTVEFDQNPFAPRRYDLTVTGATPAIDPPIWTPKRKRFWIPAATGGSTLELTPGAASITVTAQSGVVQQIANLTPSAASIVVTTQQGVLQQTANLTPGSCSIVVTQQAGTLQQVNRLSPSPAAILVTQQSGTIQEVNRLSPTPAAILVTMQAGLLQAGATNIVPGEAQILVTMQAGVVVVPVNGIVFASATISAPTVRATISAPTATTSIATAKAFATIAVPKETATISRPTVAASITRF